MVRVGDRNEPTCSQIGSCLLDEVEPAESVRALLPVGLEAPSGTVLCGLDRDPRITSALGTPRRSTIRPSPLSGHSDVLDGDSESWGSRQATVGG